MIDAALVPSIALVSGAAAVLVWSLVLLRAALAMKRGTERRPVYLLIALVGLIVALGMLASGSAMAVLRGLLDLEIDALSLIASASRGAFVTAGVIFLAEYHPERRTS